MLERSNIYRRSTAYFDSGVLKLYEEPLQTIVQTEGQIRLLMDWQGFTKRADVAELEKLHNFDYRAQFIQRTLQEFLEGLEESAFNGTQIMAELVRLGFLEIKLIKMSQGRSLYHKKTGIYSDRLDNHILHEGSDNFTRAAHSRNAESVTFLYSWEQLDQETIEQSIQEFDSEWQRQDLAYDLTQEFLQQVLQEYDRRSQQRQPRIEQITPDELPPARQPKSKLQATTWIKSIPLPSPITDWLKSTSLNRPQRKSQRMLLYRPTTRPNRLLIFVSKTTQGANTTFSRRTLPKFPRLKNSPTSMKLKASSRQ